MIQDLRPELPPLPAGLRHAPVYRGYPVPYFVAWYEDGEEVPRGQGTPDFRVVATGAIEECWTRQCCWVCGKRINSSRVAFVAGPMCGVNRTSSEPPSHHECADFAAQACPFLARPHMRRREADMPENEGSAGIMIKRNPGVAMVWVTKKPGLRVAPDGGVLFQIGEPEAVRFWAHGREATRAEIDESVESGLPLLEEMAERDGPRAVTLLRSMESRFRALLPPA